MRLSAQIHVTLGGEPIHREPSFWEKMKRGLGGRLDLDTGKVRVALEATALVDQVKRSLVRLGVDNAVSLVIDDTVIFQDTDGRAGDLGDMILALSEHASVFGRGFRELRFAVEHEEAGLHYLCETRAFTEHRRGEPSAYVSVGGRVKDLEPRSGESAEDYRLRVLPLVDDRKRLEAARLQFESFVSRLEGALRAAIPEAKVEQKRAGALVVRPAGQAAPAGKGARTPVPSAPGYDPFVVYYPSPMYSVVDAMILTSFMSHAWMPHDYLVVHPSGAAIGGPADVAASPDLVSESAADPGYVLNDDFDGDGIADAVPDHFGGGADAGDAPDGGFDGGGDGGGFDGGGFDGGGSD